MRSLCLIIFGFLPVLVWGAAASQNAHGGAARRSAPQRTGEQVFAQNCGRCHQPPSTLAPRITGTVIMHMRTRARLSANDEKLLLKYLAP
jgi:cytochrome c5